MQLSRYGLVQKQGTGERYGPINGKLAVKLLEGVVVRLILIIRLAG